MENQTYLNQLLAPIGERTFFESYWEKKVLHIPARGKQFPFRFTREDYFRTLPRCPLVRATYQDDNGKHKEAQILPEDAPKFFEAGLSICATSLEQGHAGLARFLAELDKSYAHIGTFQLNGYLSPSNKGFGVHFDNHSVWILQLEGSKKWYYSDYPAITSPVTNVNYSLQMQHPAIKMPWYVVSRPDMASMNEVVLEPGDVLYLPAGAWHYTVASSYSLSLTMAQVAVTAAQFITDIVKAHALKASKGRRCLPGILIGESDAERLKANLRTVLAEGLEAVGQVLDSLTDEQLYAIWQGQLAKKHRNVQQKSGKAAPIAQQTLQSLATSAFAFAGNGKQ